MHHESKALHGFAFQSLGRPFLTLTFLFLFSSKSYDKKNLLLGWWYALVWVFGIYFHSASVNFYYEYSCPREFFLYYFSNSLFVSIFSILVFFILYF